MSDLLSTILERTREDLPKARRNRTLSDLTGMEGYHRARLSLRQALGGGADTTRGTGEEDLTETGRVRILAEVKKASPSKGVLRTPFHPVEIAESYIRHGASALSVLTNEPFFQGSLTYLEQISRITSIPLLRKDFIVDTYQVAEARAYGADALLLIMAALDDGQFSELLHAASEHGLEVLVECDRREHLDRIMPCLSLLSCVGVNNRDLRTFTTDLKAGLALLREVPDSVVRISESGIATPSDLHLLLEYGIDAALIGEAFMRAEDPGLALSSLLEQMQRMVLENVRARQEEAES